MWVRSQDKKTLADYEEFSIAKSKGTTKGFIQGRRKNSGFFASDFETLGVYDSIELAIEELNNLQNTLRNNPFEVYEMR